MRRAQSFIEYAILISVIVAALVAMRIYMKRAYQGGMKKSADSIGKQYSAGSASQQTKQITVNSTEKVEYDGSQQTSGAVIENESNLESKDQGEKAEADF